MISKESVQADSWVEPGAQSETGDPSMDVISPLVVHKALAMHGHTRVSSERGVSWSLEDESSEAGFGRKDLTSHLRSGWKEG